MIRVKNMHFGSPSHPSWTAAAEAKLRCIYSILKPHGQSSRGPVTPLLSEAKPSYVYSISKPHGQSFRGQVRLLSGEAKPSYIYTIFKRSPPQSRSQAVVCVSTPRKYRRSGYFLVIYIFFFNFPLTIFSDCLGELWKRYCSSSNGTTCGFCTKCSTHLFAKHRWFINWSNR